MSSEKVLICGAGVAGSVLAFWLAKYDYQVTVIERSRAEQKLGQGLEIEEPALTIVKSMGIIDKLREKKTIEAGTEILDQSSRSYARFDAAGFSPTGELELMRGDLTEVLYRAADEFNNVTYRFETTIRSLSQTQDKVTVELENRNEKRTTTEEFDFVIGADGIRSRTRQLVMGSPEQLDCFKPIGAYCAYFSIPKQAQDWPYSKVCQYPERRVAWLRPARKDSNETSVYLMYLNSDAPALHEANLAGDRNKQKAAFADLFAGLGWETPRIVEQMMKADNFYSDELMQVKLKNWSQGRVALVGDSAWAPTPWTGQGNQLAILGGYVLAQEMSRNRTPLALQQYEKRLRSHVEECQKIPLSGYMPYMVCPQTSWGIAFFRLTMGLVSFSLRVLSWTGLMGLFGDGHEEVNFDLEMKDQEKKVVT